MKTLFAAGCLIAGLMGLSTPGFAWSDTGQETACYIAYAEMKPETRAKVEALIPGGADAFAEACTWASHDWMKLRHPSERYLNPSRNRRAAYNYINVPRDMSSLPADGCPQAERCLLTAIERDRNALAAADASPEDRAQALKLLSYWVGRIHQPLAVGFRDDLIGHRIHMTGLTYCQGTLHHLWADCMVDYAMMLKGAKNTTMFADALEHDIGTAQRSQWRQKLTPTAWADESLEIATMPAFGYCIQGTGGCRYQKQRLNFSFDHQVDGRTLKNSQLSNEENSTILTPGGKVTSTQPMGAKRLPKMHVKMLKLDEVYIAHFAPLVEYRLKQAGVRLAAVLDAALAADAPAVSGGAASR